MDKIVQRVLDQWGREQRNKLSERVHFLISCAKWDLSFGPANGNELDTDEFTYPGWKRALDEIADGLESIHIDDIWINIQFEDVSTSEPEGCWLENPEYDPNDENSEPQEWVEPDWEDIYHIDAKTVRRAIVGELSEYL
jgi:hypothetical protein